MDIEVDTISVFRLLSIQREQITFWVKLIVGAHARIPATLGATPIQSGNCLHSQNANYVNEIITLINTERANVGLQTLTASTQIAAFAQRHAEDRAFNNFLSHDGSDGSFREKMAHYSYNSCSDFG